jgi:putative ATP-dependent endonuclease of OLD family
MARIHKLTIEGYRSIGERIEIVFPPGQPVVLVGENNAGKSNIVRALELVLGPFWPGNHEPEDHEFFGRNPSRPIEIQIEFDPNGLLGSKYQQLVWRYNRSDGELVYFRGIEASGREGYVRNEDRDTCMCIVVEAERNLRYHTSYASKWTFLSRLMHRFHGALTGNQAVRSDLEDLFEQVKQKFHEVSEFRGFVTGLQKELEDLVTSMPHRLQVDFEAYNPVNFFHALRVQAVDGNEPRTLDEMGTGEQQILALAFAYAYAKAFHGGIVLVIEEPEAHLHPLAQQWLAQRLRSKCSEGLQVLITTHSPAFVSVEGLEGLVLVYKENGSTLVRQLTCGDIVKRCVEPGTPAASITQDNILSFFAANATTELLSGFLPDQWCW